MTKTEKTILYLGAGVAATYVLARPLWEDLMSKLRGLFGAGGEIPPPDANIPVSITDPEALEQWSPMLAHTVDAIVTNLSTKTFDIFVGMTILDENEQVVKDFDAKQMTISPGTKNISWVMYPYAFGNRGHLNVIVKTWDKYPSPDANTLGVDGVTFIYEHY